MNNGRSDHFVVRGFLFPHVSDDGSAIKFTALVTDTGQRFPEGKLSEEFKIPLPPLVMHILHSLQDVNDFFPLMVVDIFLDQCLNSRLMIQKKICWTA
jgi:hypothetical protein